MRIVELPAGEKAPAGADRIVLRQVDQTEYQVDGALIMAGAVELFEQESYQSERDALLAALNWARKHEAKVIFIERRL
jgi:hypothetical protein